VGAWNEKPAKTFVESKTDLAGFAFPLLDSVLRVSASLPFVRIRRWRCELCRHLLHLFHYDLDRFVQLLILA